ncbi:condensation domain-containing protein [Nonomuraea sp. 3-1Str]|uniref:condensation domain-containing protein n=1 Tax=Nonomuraea sp. 3-1Str TaxID=2929801 RepID=UPI0028584EB6|nr:condensation domain-containing protein [Nonomuraea sp. 3-1Str]MDR8412888.1 condensation domain-containing protein [Nonomuraea sp. 3-1Str]
MVLASQAQHGMWITEVMHGTGTAYHMPFAMWFDGPLDREAMLAACRAVVARHPVLGCAFEERDGSLHLVPASGAPPIAFVVEPDPRLLVEREIALPFELSAGPLARFTLVEMSPSRHLLLFVGHHLVFDGISKDLLVRDLAAAYSGAPSPPLPMPYGTAEEPSPEARAYWRARWREVPHVVINGASRTPRLAEHGETVLRDLTHDLPDLPGLTRFQVFLAAVHALLHRYGNADTSVAVSMSTRTAETRDHIGLFATELPVFSSFPPGGSFRELALGLRDELRELNAFREVPVARAVGGIKPRAALAPVSISYRRRAPDQVFPGLSLSVDWKMSNHMVRNALHLQAVDGADGLLLTLHHSPDVISRRDVELAADHLSAVLRAVSADPEVRLADLPLLGAPVPAPVPAPVAAPLDATVDAPAAGLAHAGAGGELVEGELIEQVRLIWMEVLRMDHIAPDEDLYDLGGHSLTITQISARIRKRLGVEVPFDVFLDDPTIIGVAAAIDGLRS